jgi:hypothetical protein
MPRLRRTPRLITTRLGTNQCIKLLELVHTELKGTRQNVTNCFSLVGSTNIATLLDLGRPLMRRHTSSFRPMVMNGTAMLRTVARSLLATRLRTSYFRPVGSNDTATLLERLVHEHIRTHVGSSGHFSGLSVRRTAHAVKIRTNKMEPNSLLRLSHAYVRAIRFSVQFRAEVLVSIVRASAQQYKRCFPVSVFFYSNPSR